MPIHFDCECGKPFWTADANAGRRMLCTRCGRELGIPQLREEGIVFIEPARSLAWRLGRSLRRPIGNTWVNWGVGLACLFLFVFLFLPMTRSGTREPARRAQCVNNLKQIGLALHNYHTEHGAFPPRAITDSGGKPLLSWRVALLPYLEQQELYHQFKLDEPWDSPTNWPLIAKMPHGFACPSQKDPLDGKTRYQVIRGPGALFDGDKPPAIPDVTDGLPNTFCVVEARNPVAWTKPDDVDIRSIGTDLGSEHPGGFNILMVDGAVRFLKMTLSPASLRAMATKSSQDASTLEAF